MMQPKKTDRQRIFLCLDLLDQLDPRNRLLGFAKVIPWQMFEDNSRPLYAASGRSGKSDRLIVGLLILKQVENLSDECVVEAWIQAPYFQAFCGQQRFTCKLPCDPSELTYFRRRIGKDGVRKVFEVSVALHGDKASVTVTKTSGIIVGALSFQDNPFDGHALPAVLSQVESIVGQRATMAICARGYRGKRKVGLTRIKIPESGMRSKTASDKRQARERVRGHRADHRPSHERPQDVAQLPPRAVR